MSTTDPARPANLSPEGEQALNDLHDWFEGQLAAALGNPPLSAREVEDGDEHAGSLEELIELVKRRYALPRTGAMSSPAGRVRRRWHSSGISQRRSSTTPACSGP